MKQTLKMESRERGAATGVSGRELLINVTLLAAMVALVSVLWFQTTGEGAGLTVVSLAATLAGFCTWFAIDQQEGGVEP